MGQENGTSLPLLLVAGVFCVVGLLVGLLFYFANEMMFADTGFAFFVILLIIIAAIIAWPQGGGGNEV